MRSKKDKMTKNTEVIDGIKFRIGSDKHIIYSKYYKLGLLDTKQISQETNIPQKSVSWYISKFKKSQRVILTQVRPLQSNEVGTSSQEEVDNNKYNNILDLEIKDEDDGLFIYIKASVEFEEYLKKTKQIQETNNLFGASKTSKFYQFRIVNNYLDDINSKIFYSGQINFGLLRIPGISNGLKFKIDGLMTENQIRSGLTKLGSTFKTFYKVNVENIKSSYKLEVLEEK